jgi:hypothetical protein
MERIQQNDVGYAIEIPITDRDKALDLAGNTGVSFIFEMASGKTFIRQAAVKGPEKDGTAQYISAPGDLSEWGKWWVQALVSFQLGRTFYSQRKPFYVDFNLVPPPIVICPTPVVLEMRALVSGLNVGP